MPENSAEDLNSKFKKVLTFSDTTLKTEKFQRRRVRVKEILFSPQKGLELVGKTITVAGWARTVRNAAKNTLAFVALSDGSCFDSLQVVASAETTENFEELLKAGGIGASFRFTGEVVESPNKGSQSVEVNAKEVTVLGTVDANKYPLKKTKHAHSMEFLRENAHLRPRTNLIGAVARVRNALAFATHKFFQERGFQYIHTPLITAADGEGAGEMFQVSTILKPTASEIPEVDSKTEKLLKKKGSYHPKKGEIDFSKDFFSKPAFLTVTGQLNVETFACALSDVYTFGPTFRAENSHTSRHLAEFWQIEPEMCFTDLKDNMDIAEDFLKYCTQFALDNCPDDLDFFEKRIEKGLIERLNNVVQNDFERLTYTDAIEILLKEENLEKGQFAEKPYWGIDLASEHERFLTETIYKKPVIVVDYPADFKAFYMKRNKEKVSTENGERETVQGMDILVPKIGEVIGGSVREENLELLKDMMEKKGQKIEEYEWYLDLRRYGSVPHSGFGAGFERLVMFVTGVENIRDVIPFPRVPGQCEF